MVRWFQLLIMENIIMSQLSLDEFKLIISETIRKELETIPREISIKKKEIYGTRKEVARELHISLPTLNELTKSGILKGYRLQRRVLYKWSEIEDSLREIKSPKYRRAI